jgi:hypothetical protein
MRTKCDLKVFGYSIGREKYGIGSETFVLGEHFGELGFYAGRAAETVAINIENDGLNARRVPSVDLAVRQEPLVVPREQIAKRRKDIEAVVRAGGRRQPVRATDNRGDPELAADCADAP